MSEPTPVPNPAPAPPVKIDWQAWTRSGVILLTILSAIFLKDDTKPDVKPDVPAVEVVKVVPQPAPVIVTAEPEQYILTDLSTGRRTSDPTLEAMLPKLKVGKYGYQGIPKPGEIGTNGTITIADGTTPPEPPPPPPVVVVPPVVVPPVVTIGPRQVLLIRESSKDTPELSRLLIGMRNGEPAGYLKSRGHRFFVLDDNDATPLVEKWRTHYSGMKLPVVLILNDKAEIVHKQEIPPTSAEPSIVLEILKAHGG